MKVTRLSVPVVLPATPADARLLAPALRPEDKREVSALSGLDPEDDLLSSLDGEAYAIKLEGEEVPLGMFGINPGPLLGDLPFATIWLLAAQRLFDYRLTFLRESRRWLEAFHATYPVLGNVIDSRNTEHIRWVDWLGFAIDPRPLYCGADSSVPFYRILRVSLPCVVPLPS